jgi:hypothetical protein
VVANFAGPDGEPCFSLLWEVSPEIGLWIVGQEGGPVPHLFPAYQGGAEAEVELLAIEVNGCEAIARCRGADFHLNNYFLSRLWRLKPGHHLAQVAGLAYGWRQVPVAEPGMETTDEPCTVRFAGTVESARTLINPWSGIRLSHVTLDFGLEVVGLGEAGPGDRIRGEAWLQGMIPSPD